VPGGSENLKYCQQRSVRGRKSRESDKHSGMMPMKHFGRTKYNISTRSTKKHMDVFLLLHEYRHRAPPLSFALASSHASGFTNDLRHIAVDDEMKRVKDAIVHREDSPPGKSDRAV
jgi:hypothetical protein